MKPQEQSTKIQAGGYHSRGTPGEEAEARRPMRPSRIADSAQRINRSFPIKGGGGAESTAVGREEEATSAATAQPTGERVLYVLTRRDSEWLDTPVLSCGDEGEQSGIPVFTTRDKALRYLQVADWARDHEPGALAPANLVDLFEQARQSDVDLAIVDPDRLDHQQGKPQPVLLLAETSDLSGDALFRAVRELAQGTAPGT